MGCDMLVTFLEVHSGVQTGIIRRRVRAFADNSIIGAFGDVVLRKGLVVSTDGTGDMLPLSLVGLCLDVIGVGHWKVLHISHFRHTCGKNDGQNTYPSHHADGIDGANLEGPTG